MGASHSWTMTANKDPRIAWTCARAWKLYARSLGYLSGYVNECDSTLSLPHLARVILLSTAFNNGLIIWAICFRKLCLYKITDDKFRRASIQSALLSYAVSMDCAQTCKLLLRKMTIRNDGSILNICYFLRLNVCEVVKFFFVHVRRKRQRDKLKFVSRDD